MFLIKTQITNCHNLRVSYNIDMNLIILSKLGKRNNTMTLKKLIKTSFRQTISSSLFFFSISGQFVAIHKPEFGCMVRALDFFINNYLFYKKETENGKQTYKIMKQDFIINYAISLLIFSFSTVKL